MKVLAEQCCRPGNRLELSVESVRKELLTQVFLLGHAVLQQLA